jgi:hypothetical protein
VALAKHPAEGREWDGTAGREQAAVADCHAAVRPDMWEEPTDQLHDVKARSTEACTAHVTGGEGDRAVGEADATVVGDGALEARGGERGEGGGAGVLRLPVDVPGESPDLGGAVLQQSGLAQTFLAERAGEG